MNDLVSVGSPADTFAIANFAEMCYNSSYKKNSKKTIDTKSETVMKYRFDVDSWGGHFSVPCSVATEYLKTSDGNYLKVLLCIL